MKVMSSAGQYGLALVLAVVTIAAGAPEAPVADAAKDADWTAVRALVVQGTDVNTPRGDGSTALHWASYWDNGEIADLLIQAGADVNAVTDLGVTALWAASENGSPDMVARLLRAEANPNTALRSGETPLMTAARTGDPDVVRLLLVDGADHRAATRDGSRGQQTALMWAVAQQHPAAVEVLLEYGADVHARTSVFMETVKTMRETRALGRQCLPREECYLIDIQRGGYTPLLFAARVGALASARLLVAAGADVNDVAPQGTSALVVAAHSGHGDVGTLLLEHGADPNAAGAGYTPLHGAILQNDARLVAALLAAGADPETPLAASTPVRRDSVDYYFHPAFVGATPFWLAARFKSAEIMRLLAEHGADPLFVHNPQYWDADRQNYGRQEFIIEGETTALMAAVGIGGRNPIIATEHRARVTESARVGRQRNEGRVAAMTLEAVKAAVEMGVDVNKANFNGQTALRTARGVGYDAVVEYLVEQGATIN